MIPQELLKNFQARALGIGAYGNGGLEKTLAARTLPPPILHLDFEGGSGCLGPWTRRIRRWDGTWLNYSQEDREKLFNLVSPEKRKRALIAPRPFIDIVSFNLLTEDAVKRTSPAYDECFNVLANLDTQYNSIALDPLVEFSSLTQDQARAIKGVTVTTPMEVQYWGGAQERAAILLRRLRNYRDQGVFIYMTSSEFVDKDYGTDPRSKEKGAAAEEPYAIKGTLNVPGKLVGVIQHMMDVLCHVRMLNGQPVWVTQEEPARSGSFNWDAKDRTGRLAEKYVLPNIRTVIEQVYGKEAKELIYSGGTQ